MSLYQKFLLLTRGKQIALVVVAIHLSFVFSLTVHHVATRRLKPPRPMVVKTISLTIPKVIAVQPKQQKAPNPKPAPVAAKKSPVVKKESAKSIKPMQAETKKPRPALAIPSKLEKREAEAIEEPINNASYSEYLIAFLQNTLDLPEYGEVRAKIWIDRFGKLIDCEILEAKSAKNAEFLKNQLPDLSFACLNDFGIFETSQTFTITFRNVEIR